MEHQQNLESVEEIFPKILKTVKLKMNFVKSKNGKNKIIEMIWNMN